MWGFTDAPLTHREHACQAPLCWPFSIRRVAPHAQTTYPVPLGGWLFARCVCSTLAVMMRA